MRSAKLHIGSTPWGEECAQVGSPNYEARARLECEAYKHQLVRHLEARYGKRLPDTVWFTTTSNPHDLGTYYEVAAIYDVDDEEAVRIAFDAEAHSPEAWDEASLRFLNRV